MTPTVKSNRTLMAALVFALLFLALSSITNIVYGQAKKKQLIWTLSSHQMNSDKLEFSGVPVQCFINRGRSKGTFITKLNKGGPAYNSGIRAGDVVLKINDRVIYNARIADSVIQSSGGQTARVEIAKSYGNNLQVRNFNVNWSNLVSVTPSGSNSSNHNSISKRKKQEEQVSTKVLEDYLFSLINADRKANGNLPPYSRSSRLSGLARKYAEDQAKRGFTGHRDPEGRMPQDRAREAGITVAVAENVAFCEGDALTYAGKVKWCEDTMMAEPPNQMNHRSAILSENYTCVGVGVGISASGRVCIAQEFSPASVP